MVKNALKGSYSMVSGGALSRAAKEQGSRATSTKGRSLAARALRVDAVVGGSVKRVGSRWVLKVVVYSGHNGRRTGSATLPLRGARVDPGTARRVVGKVRSSINRCRAGAAVARKASSTPRKRQRAKPRPRRRPRPVAVRPAPAPAPRNDFDDGTDAYQSPVNDPEPLPQAPAEVATAVEDETAGFSTGGGARSNAAAGGGGDELGFDVAGGGGRTQQPATFNSQYSGGSFQGGVNAQQSSRPPWEKIIEISVGAMLVNRWFTIGDPSREVPYDANFDDPKKRPPDSSVMTSAFHLEGALYPFAIFSRSPIAGLGIAARYYRVFQLQLLNDDGKTQNEKGPFNTTYSVMELGLRYRWNILGRLTSPTYIAGLDYGRQLFVIHDGQDLIKLPDITHQYLNLALVGLEVPFTANANWSVGLNAGFDYLLVFNSGHIENNDNTGYGRSSTGGIEAEAGLYFTYKGFFMRLNGAFRYLWYSFSPQECVNRQNRAMGCKNAEDASEKLASGYLRVGYAY